MITKSLEQIEHIVVLMLENRSFDHMLGGLPNVNGAAAPSTTGTASSGGTSLTVASAAGITQGQLVTGMGIAAGTFVAGVAGTTVTLSQATIAALSATPVGFGNCNLSNPFDQTSPPYVQTPISVGTEPPDFNPYHDFNDMMKQMFGPNATGFANGEPVYWQSQEVYPPSQSGYVNDYKGNPDVMNYFADDQLQVLQTLAKNFVVCDNWFCDVPAYTQPNRLFMHAATSQGILGVSMPAPGDIPARTIFEQIDKNLTVDHPDKAWKMYSFLFDERDSDYFAYTRNDPRGQKFVVTDFFVDAYNGTLPFYSFLMPVLNSAPAVQCNSMHPPSDVRYGENYLAAVYNSLFGQLQDKATGQWHYVCPDWDKTLLIVTFDENGAIYDHAVPPVTQSPDGIDANGYDFDFTSLGPRIPALLISPWLGAGVDRTQYQNTSILRCIQDMLTPQEKPLYLTQRDLHANSIENAFVQFGLGAARTDCPEVTGYAGFQWNSQNLPDGTNYDTNDPTIDDAPAAFQVELAKEYLAFLPGHPDSGKPITREFSTYAELNRYREERRQAARKAETRRAASA